MGGGDAPGPVTPPVRGRKNRRRKAGKGGGKVQFNREVVEIPNSPGDPSGSPGKGNQGQTRQGALKEVKKNVPPPPEGAARLTPAVALPRDGALAERDRSTSPARRVTLQSPRRRPTGR